MRSKRVLKGTWLVWLNAKYLALFRFWSVQWVLRTTNLSWLIAKNRNPPRKKNYNYSENTNFQSQQVSVSRKVEILHIYKYFKYFKLFQYILNWFRYIYENICKHWTNLSGAGLRKRNGHVFCKFSCTNAISRSKTTCTMNYPWSMSDFNVWF